MSETTLRNELNSLLLSKTSEPDEVPASLGAVVGGVAKVKVPGRSGWVYARIRGSASEYVEAFNERTDYVYDLPVILNRDHDTRNFWRVMGRDIGRYSEWVAGSQLGPHGKQHSFGGPGSGTDIVWVFKRQFMPMLVSPFSGTTLAVWDDYYAWGNSFKHFTGQFIDLAGGFPAANYSRWMLLYLDGNSNSVSVSTGTAFSSYNPPADILSAIPSIGVSQGLPLGAVLLSSTGTHSNISWDNLYDVRTFLNGPGSAASLVQQIVLYHPASSSYLEFPVTVAGMQSAIASAVSGDAIVVPEVTLASSFTIPAGVTISGQDAYTTVIQGTITLNVGSALDFLQITNSSASTGTVYGIIGPSSGVAPISRCAVSVSNYGSGNAVAFRMVPSGGVALRDCFISSFSSGTSSYIAYWENGATGTFAVEGGCNFVNGPYSYSGAKANFTLFNTGTFTELYGVSWPSNSYPSYANYRDGDRAPWNHTHSGTGSSVTSFVNTNQIPWGMNSSTLTGSSSLQYNDAVHQITLIGPYLSNGLPYSGELDINPGYIRSYAFGSNVSYFGYSANGTKASPSAVTNGWILNKFSGGGYAATGWSSGTRAMIDLITTEQWTDTAQGTQMNFTTTPTGTVTPIVSAIIDPVGIKNNVTNTYRTLNYQATFDRSGFVPATLNSPANGYIPYCSGTSVFWATLAQAGIQAALTNPVTGAGTSGFYTQIPFFTGGLSSVITGTDNLTWNNSTQMFQVNNGSIVSNGNSVASTPYVRSYSNSSYIDMTAYGSGAGGTYFGLSGNNLTSLIAYASSGMLLGTATNVPVVFGVNNTEVMRLTSAGLGIGTQSPWARLEVYNSANADSSFAVSTPGTGTAQQSVFNFVTKDDGNPLGNTANNRGWGFYGRGNAYTNMAGQQNYLILFYWNGTSWIPSTVFYPGGGMGNASHEVFASVTDTTVKWHMAMNTDGTSGLNFAETGVADFRLFIKNGGVVRMAHYGAGTASFDANGNISSSSDERLKNILGEFQDGLDEILRIDPILYRWNKESGMETKHTYAGFAAGNVEKYIPLAVGRDENGYRSLNDRAIIAALVNAVKKLNRKIEALKN